MVIVKIDEYLVINTYTRKRRWLTKKPIRLKTNEILVHVKGQVKFPEPIYTADFGEMALDEAEVLAQASVG